MAHAVSSNDALNARVGLLGRSLMQKKTDYQKPDELPLSGQQLASETDQSPLGTDFLHRIAEDLCMAVYVAHLGLR